MWNADLPLTKLVICVILYRCSLIRIIALLFVTGKAGANSEYSSGTATVEFGRSNTS